MTCQHLLARLDAAEARLSRTSEAFDGHGVEFIWRNETDRFSPHAVPDALYINYGDPYIRTLLYDVRRGEYLTVAWGDWLETSQSGSPVDA